MGQGSVPATSTWWQVTAITLGVTDVVVGVVLRDALISQLLLMLTLATVTAMAIALARRGVAAEGTPPFLVPCVLGVALAGHVVETVTLLLHPEPEVVSVSDVFLALFALVAAALAARARHLPAVRADIGTPRTWLDIILVAYGVLVLFVLLVVPATRAPDAPVLGQLIAYGYALLGSAVVAAQVMRALQRGEPASWLMALCTLIAVLGVQVWSISKFGPDTRVAGLVLMSLGVLLLPIALAHPGHRRFVPVEEGLERDRLDALLVHLLLWCVALTQPGQIVFNPSILVMAVPSLLLIYLRVVLIRSSERQTIERMHGLAFSDPLTGVGNRRALLSRLAAAGDAWLITIDLDGFKQVNDQYGHEAGDAVLVGYVRRARARLPREAHLARIGGDEFAVLLTGDEAHAERVGRLMVDAARDPHHARLTASVGLTWHPARTDPNTTLRNSDIAMQEAKRAGKNRLARLSREMVDARLRSLEVARRLTETLEDVEVWYQPIVSLADDGAMVAVEALARWSHPELGPVSPVEFIPIAEQEGLIPELGQVVLRKAVAQLERWIAEGAPRQVSINVSWLQLRDPDTVRRISETVCRVPGMARWIVLEVTESVFSEDEGAVTAVRLLRDLGLCIAVDDFGTGVSNLRRLRTLPIDVLKIDRSLLAGVGVDPMADAILALVNQLGESMGMTVLAEGVELGEEARVLADLGVRTAQGFLFAYPAPASELPRPAVLDRPGLGRRWLRR